MCIKINVQKPHLESRLAALASLILDRKSVVGFVVCFDIFHVAATNELQS